MLRVFFPAIDPLCQLRAKVTWPSQTGFETKFIEAVMCLNAVEYDRAIAADGSISRHRLLISLLGSFFPVCPEDSFQALVIEYFQLGILKPRCS